MLDGALRAIAEPHRREILDLVRERELSAGDIAAHFDVSRPAISQHLRILVEAALLTERRAGARRLYRARPEGLVELRSYLEDFWAAKLADLKSAAEADERGPHGTPRDN